MKNNNIFRYKKEMNKKKFINLFVKYLDKSILIEKEHGFTEKDTFEKITFNLERNYYPFKGIFIFNIEENHEKEIKEFVDFFEKRCTSDIKENMLKIISEFGSSLRYKDEVEIIE